MEPIYWKTSLDDIDGVIKGITRGTVEHAAKSAGGREIYLIRYGSENNIRRTSNLSSALGAGDRNCYADKTESIYRPTVLLTGCIHGGEFEGVAALLNLINILETGTDFAGIKYPYLESLCEKITLLIIPCANPDGRSRILFKSMVGKSFEELRYYNQGTWKDGRLCGYPECKKVHPIKNYVDFLGAYFNDDGVNIMHDDFFGVKAPETQLLFDTADKYVPDFTVLLHGGTNTVNCILKPAYAPDTVKKRIEILEKSVKLHCAAHGIPYGVTAMDRGENNEIPASFNLTSALYHFTGEPCITYESNQGLSNNGEALGYEDIYKAHLILFEEVFKEAGRRYVKKEEECRK